MAAWAQPTTRSLNEINWMEFQEFIPSKIDTIPTRMATTEAIVKEIVGPVTAKLESIATDVGSRLRVRVMVIH